ncbi:DUF4198 domain-containing protein, partial [bacterium]|nr:DUF4198 domain-containing protein [bacterium]
MAMHSFALRATAAITLALASPATAHFLVFVPSADIVMDEGPKSIDLAIAFTHPMADGPAMEMAPPVRFGVLVDGKTHDLKSTLKPRKIDGKNAYSASYRPKAPGDHVFYIQPAPYWEPAEQKMIVHYTKVVVDAFGAEEGWDAAVGFPVEIEPLVR